jgi:hypothetical protein
VTETPIPEEPAVSDDRETSATAPRSPRWRRILAAVLIVLGCVIAPVSVLGVWIHNTLLDTDQYVDTIGPLASDPAVQDALADRITNAVISGSDVEQRIADSLPERAQAAAPFIAQGARELVDRVAHRIVAGDRFANVWENVNRRAHTQVVALLEGKGTKRVSTESGKVVLQLGPALDRVRQELHDRGITTFDDAGNGGAPSTIVLIDSDGLKKAQGAVDLLDTLAFVLPVITVLLLAGGILLARDRRRALLRAALGVALAMALVLTVFNLGRSLYLDALPSTVNRDAAAALYDQLLSFLRNSLRTVFVLGLVVALAAWMTGPARAARRLREGAVDIVRKPDVPEAISPVAAFVRDHRVGLRIAVVSVGLLLLVVLTNPGPVAVLVIALLVVIGLLLVEFLGRGATRPGMPA